MTITPVTIGDDAINTHVGPGSPMLLVAGPCVIESETLCLTIAEKVKALAARLGLGYVFKASFDKANRTSIAGFRGLGMDKGLAILAKVRRELSIPVVTDIHLPDQVPAVSDVVDIVQVPAFLARQTDLLIAAAQSGKCVQVKKAQFMAPWDMKNVVDKLSAAGADRIILVERGSSFGYNRLIADMTAIPAMQELGYPVLMDATHATQLPGGQGNASGGSAEHAKILARAAIAAGADGLFIETHPDPK
ncbi:MAG: 3-deoxy-8-phosphooctulonate synthase, partial [Sedimentisphaerales bacterium]|nr:3-deoxy-8-phosphooctulonate synthase [Sedimentisphaerales bacterium]